jgi:hypothetical protein
LEVSEGRKGKGEQWRAQSGYDEKEEAKMGTNRWGNGR